MILLIFRKEKGTGFKTNHSFFEINSPNEYIDTLTRAINTIQNREVKNKIIKNALTYDSSWNFNKIIQYNNVYNSVINK